MLQRRKPYLGEAPIQPEAQPAAGQPYEEPGDYVFRRTLQPNESIPDLSQFVDKDSDFVLVAIAGTSTGPFSVQFRNAGNRAISSSEELAQNCIGTGQFPVPLLKPLVYPAGGRIGIAMSDLSGALNVVEIVFRGIKRYRTAA